MNIGRTVARNGILALSLTGLLGCDDKGTSVEKNESPAYTPPAYFAEVPLAQDNNLVLTNGDFDGDGDLDIVLGAKPPFYTHAKLYLFKNDGQGNFTVYTPVEKK